MTDILRSSIRTHCAATIRRHGLALLATCAFVPAVLGVAPAMAGCNSGDVGQSATLSSSTCRASAVPIGALAVGSISTIASGNSSTALGIGATASNQNDLAVGSNAGASGGDAIAIGGAAQAFGYEGTAIGAIAQANGNYALAIGLFAGGGTQPGYISLGAGTDAGTYATAIGNGNPQISPSNYGAQANGSYSIAIGGGDHPTDRPAASANSSFGISIGTSSTAVGTRSIALGAYAGDNANANNHRNTALGTESGRFVNGVGNTAAGLAAGHTVGGDLNSALGNSAGQAVTGNANTAMGVSSGSTVTGSGNTAYGNTAGQNVTGHQNVAVGPHAGKNITATNTIAIGTLASATLDNTIAVGFDSSVTGVSSVALGWNARATKARSVALGNGSLANAPDTVSVGTASKTRRIVNVSPAVNANDAVNLAQVQSMIASAPAVMALAMRRPPVATPPADGSGHKPSGSGAPPVLASAGSSRAAAAGQPSGEATAPRGSAVSGQGDTAELQSSEIVGWANVGQDGALAAARNISGNARHGTGEYEIAFVQPSLRRCTFNATLSGIGFVSVKPGSMANSLRVETRNHLGAMTDASFYLMAVC